MSIPGINIFRIASRVIKPTKVQYMRYLGRTLNAARQYVPQYDTSVYIMASVQPVDRSVYALYGLDVQKNYITVFAAVDTIDIQRDTSSDIFVWNGAQWQIDSKNDWVAQDGWMSCKAVKLGGAA